MTQPSRLPASHSDFVLTVTGEEVSWSLIGPVLVLLVLVGAAVYFRRWKKAGK